MCIYTYELLILYFFVDGADVTKLTLQMALLQHRNAAQYLHLRREFSEDILLWRKSIHRRYVRLLLVTFC